MDFEYSADSFDILEGLEPIRKDPTMYVNSTGVDGIFQLLMECIDNSVDESKVLEGIRLVKCIIKLNRDGSAIIEDNGRGIPVEINKKHGIPAIYIALEYIHGGAKLYNKSSYGASIGVHGVGLSCVNALSKRLSVTVKRDGNIYNCKYEYGRRSSELCIIGKCDINDTGTIIEFLYDDSILTLDSGFKGKVEYPFDVETLKDRLEKYMYFNSNIEFDLYFDTDKKSGLIEYKRDDYSLEELIEMHTSKYSFVKDEDKELGYIINIYLGISKNMDLNMTAVNGLYLIEEGSHVAAFKSVIKRLVLDQLSKDNVIDTKYKLRDGEILRGISYIITLDTPKATFMGQVKNKYENPSISMSLYDVYRYLLNTSLKDIFQTHYENVKQYYVNKLKEIEVQLNKKTNKLPHLSVKEEKKLMELFYDCSSNDKDKNECWLLEGKSASGTFAETRDGRYESYLLLQGKPINVSKKSERVESSRIFKSIASVIKMNKHSRFILCTDADVDGYHIRSLVLNLFVNYFPTIIKEKRLYLAYAPLYKYSLNGKYVFAYDDEQAEELTRKGAVLVTRFKGLGGIDKEDFRKTVVEADNKVLVVHNKDSIIDEETGLTSAELVKLIMGEDPVFRREIVLRRFAGKKLYDFYKNKSKIMRSSGLKLDNKKLSYSTTGKNLVDSNEYESTDDIEDILNFK